MAQTPQQLILRAASFAAEHHRDQRRKGAQQRPYINHPLEVAQMVAEIAGITDPEVIAAALLHDTVEDTEATAEDILREFGPRVAAVVAEVTDDKSLPKAERKALQISHAPHLSEEAAHIKIADKIANVKDLVRDPPVHWPTDRVAAYLDWSEAVVGGIQHPNPGLLEQFEEAIAAGRAALRGGDSN